MFYNFPIGNEWRFHPVAKGYKMLMQRGEVRNVPSFNKMGKNRDRRQPSRFTICSEGSEREVEVLLLNGRSIIGETHTWDGVVCPVETVTSGEGAFAVHVTTQDQTGVGTFV